MYYYENILLCISLSSEVINPNMLVNQPETLFHFKTNGWIYRIPAKVFTINCQSARES
jgi:hypothetical protein